MMRPFDMANYQTGYPGGLGGGAGGPGGPGRAGGAGWNQTHARNTDSARIRAVFRSLFGLSPMNVDMSVSLVMPETLT